MDAYTIKERLMGVERAARLVIDTAKADESTEVPVALAFAMMGLRDALAKVDEARAAVEASRA